jgi:hypothetical protein
MTGVVVFVFVGSFFVGLMFAEMFGTYARRRKGRKGW